MAINSKLLEDMKNTPHKEWPLPECIDVYAGQGKKCLVIGSAACVFDDLQKIDGHGYDCMAVNDMIMYAPYKLIHAVSLCHRWLPKWVAARREEHRKHLDFHDTVLTHSNKRGDGVKYAWNLSGNGTSGLFAATVAVAMGYGEVVLAGIPMDNSGHFFDPPRNRGIQFPTQNYDKIQGLERQWNIAIKHYFEDKVRSLSGNTREWLGEP